MELLIGEFAKRTGLGIHTLRYYEKEGLLIPVRKANNRRFYCERDLVWIDFIKRLKATGMPIREIKRYAELRTAGDLTLRERMELLVQHRSVLVGRISELQEHLGKLDEKIAFYRKEIEGRQRIPDTRQ